MTTTAPTDPSHSPLPAPIELPVLRALSDQFHNVDAGLAEVARLSA
ncbi:MAG: hypothetical protein JWO31_66, partial [Phycisphaerales bacterium]|nr:hypothetical protein [Phycisphaerales bacterium]